MSLIFASLLMAQATAAAPQQAADPSANQIICHAGQSEVGTHMRPKPVCMKKSEWDLVESNTQNQLSRVQDRSSFNPGMAQGGGRGPQ